MKLLIRVMKALSDSSRITILKMLEKKELCVCEITAIVGLAQPTVSKHLKILEDADLVIARKSGQWVNYSLQDGPENEYARAMLSQMPQWLAEDPAITAAVAQVKTIDRLRIAAA